mgnify:CR=1 FL=1|jgi:hypothetical protein
MSGDNHDEGVYLIEHEHGYIKIGRSVNPVQRISTLETACPYELHLMGFIKTNDAPQLEARLHEKYETYQKSGEWYNLPTRAKIHLIKLCDLNKEQVDARYGRSDTDRRRSTLTYQGLVG